MNSSERMPIAEGTVNHLAGTVQERLTARAGMALCYRRFARNSVTAGIAVPRDRTPGRRRWWPCSIRPAASGICP